MKLSKRLEDIFSHAVALQQSGRLKSTIYCVGKKIYILNQDQTVIMRFRLRDVDREGGKALEFKEPISFDANDYDSNNVEERDGRICFLTSSAGFQRVKSCKTPHMSPAQVEEMYKGYELEEVNQVWLHKDVLSLLDDSLSHIEFSADNGAIKIVQRNIYSGSVLEITREKSEGFGLQPADKVKAFEPIGLRTNDFLALFSFVDSFNFYFQPGGVVWAESGDTKWPLRVLVAKCKYDELGGVSDGRKEPQDGRSE